MYKRPLFSMVQGLLWSALLYSECLRSPRWTVDAMTAEVLIFIAL